MANGIKQPRATRALLEDQLVTVFKKRGYEGATLTQLAESTGLGKASLYHHFPGGKAEMAAVLLRRSVARLQKAAFSRLGKSAPAALRLQQFVDGFSTYAQNGEMLRPEQLAQLFRPVERHHRVDLPAIAPRCTPAQEMTFNQRNIHVRHFG